LIRVSRRGRHPGGNLWGLLFVSCVGRGVDFEETAVLARLNVSEADNPLGSKSFKVGGTHFQSHEERSLR
jgi:hypothetical protein